MPRNKIALFGLSADPLHWGHIAYIEYCKMVFPHHLIVLMPCKINPLGKRDQEGKYIYPADSRVRFNILNDYFAKDERIIVSSYEIDNPKPSYTINTIHYLQHVRFANLVQHQPFNEQFIEASIQSDITLLIGTDNFLQLPQWYCWKDILAQSCVAILRRKSYVPIKYENIKHPELKREFIDRVDNTGQIGTIMQLDGPQLDISSTYIRKLLQEGASDEILSQYLPLSILKLIRVSC